MMMVRGLGAGRYQWFGSWWASFVQGQSSMVLISPGGD